jgi:hypothetical protein
MRSGDRSVENWVSMGMCKWAGLGWFWGVSLYGLPICVRKSFAFFVGKYLSFREVLSKRESEVTTMHLTSKELFDLI